MNTEHSLYDVVIAGAGLTGLSLAYALAKIHPWRIAVVENQEEQVLQPASFDERVLALSAMSVRILKALDLWGPIAEQGHRIEAIHVSDKGSYGKVRLRASEHGLDEFGQVMPARVIGEVFQQAVKQLPLDWYRPAHIVSTDVNEHYRTVQLSSGVELKARLLVVAEGGKSQTCRLLGIQAEQHDYQHVAVIANIKTDKLHSGLAIERFNPTGPIALLPMPENRRSLVWTLPPQQAEEVRQLADDDFISELQQAVGYRYGLIEKVGSRYSYPLELRLVDKTALPRAVVIGNAAHALHPIAGQGFNLAIRDVMELAMLLNDCRAQNEGCDTGDFSMLSQYQQNRKKDQHSVARATHALAVLFSNDFLPIKFARSGGLSVMAHLQPARDMLVSKAMGVSSLSRVVEEWKFAKL